jgi:hypothetical protein
MAPMKAVEAVIVNHNTSVYAELALRSLRHVEDGQVPLNITIMDNHSTDDTRALLAAASALDARFETSRWPAAEAQRNTHGDVLRDFVMSRRDVDAFLFVESDICFLTKASVSKMVKELQAPDTWAIQARLIATQRHTSEELVAMTLAYQRRGRQIGLKSQLFGPRGGEIEALIPETMHWATIMPRCHPGGALVRNDEVLQRTARYIGFAQVWSWSSDRYLEGFGDTLGMVSQVMRTHGRRYAYSETSVLHFWHGTRTATDPDVRALRLLHELRCGGEGDLMTVAFES